MPSAFSIDSIRELAGSFAGASTSDLTKLSVPSKYLPEEETGETSILLWGHQFGGTQVVHGVRFQRHQTCEHAIDIQPVLLRVLCHVLIDQIPDRGLTDVRESLHEFREFYRSPVETVQRLPEPELRLRLRPSQIRPEFGLDDEE